MERADLGFPLQDAPEHLPEQNFRVRSFEGGKSTEYALAHDWQTPWNIIPTPAIQEASLYMLDCILP